MPSRHNLSNNYKWKDEEKCIEAWYERVDKQEEKGKEIVSYHKA